MARKKRRRGKKRVRVYLDEVMLLVPERVDCQWAARGALGLRRSERVAYLGSDAVLHFQGGHTFRSGDRYQTLGPPEAPPTPADAAGSTEDSPGEDEGLAPWERDPSWWRQDQAGDGEP